MLTCTICTDQITEPYVTPASRDEFDQAPDESRIRLLCTHVFHKSCLKEQIAGYPLVSENAHLCANCRQPIEFVTVLTKEQIEEKQDEQAMEEVSKTVDLFEAYLGCDTVPSTEGGRELKGGLLGHLIGRLLRVDMEAYPYFSCRIEAEAEQVRSIAFNCHKDNRDDIRRFQFAAAPQKLDATVAQLRATLSCFRDADQHSPTVLQRAQSIHMALDGVWGFSCNATQTNLDLPKSSNPADILAPTGFSIEPDPLAEALQEVNNEMDRELEVAEAIEQELTQTCALSSERTPEHNGRRAEMVGHLIRAAFGIDTQRYPHFRASLDYPAEGKHCNFKLKNLKEQADNAYAHTNLPESIPALAARARESIPDLATDRQHPDHDGNTLTAMHTVLPFWLGCESDNLMPIIDIDFDEHSDIKSIEMTTSEIPEDELDSDESDDDFGSFLRQLIGGPVLEDEQGRRITGFDNEGNPMAEADADDAASDSSEALAP